MEWICQKENRTRIQSIFAFVTGMDEKELDWKLTSEEVITLYS